MMYCNQERTGCHGAYVALRVLVYIKVVGDTPSGPVDRKADERSAEN